MSASQSVEGEPPRKRVRKGTKSCWECKRRKVRCQLGSEDVPVCSGCLARGTTCLSQEYPEERDPSSGTQVGERLGRIEQVLEKLVAKIEQFEEEENSAKILTPDSSSNNDAIAPYLATVISNHHAETATVWQGFDNPQLGRGTASQSQVTTPSTQTAAAKSCRTPKLEKIRQALVELLPTQRETNLICEASSCWLLVHAIATRNSEPVSASTFNLAEVSKEHPTKLARTVLYIAVCLQQLDPGFDTSQLRIYPTVQARMEKCINVVQALITSDDELVSTMTGLECLTLQGVFHMNAGQPRRGWLTFRRALSIGQLMGIQKRETMVPGGREMWHQIVHVDRYLALLLGLPAGSTDPGFGPEETFENPDIDKDMLFVRKLCKISGHIIERNQSESSHAYAATQDIDEALEKLAKKMSQAWWDTPDAIPQDRETAPIIFHRIIFQIWFFQIEALAHLPFMLRASTERRYDYSKFSCLKASREMIPRYLALRRADNKSFCCKVVDFAALTACVTLFLGLLDPVTETEGPLETHQRENDRALVQTVMESMEELSNGGKDVVATQSINVLKSLSAVDDSSGNSTGNLKLTIPYFGTISIVRPNAAPVQAPTTNFSSIQLQQKQQQPEQRAVPIAEQLASQPWGSYSLPPQSPAQILMNQPMISFQSSQFPPPLPNQQSIHDWALPEADTLFFDSLLNTDIEGNWIF